jgi:tetratricopeptide (TPR) repeat protein
MNMKEQMEQIFKEIEVYSSHSLYELARQKYLELVELVENSDQLEHKDALLLEISRQVESIEDEERNFEGVEKATKMSSKELDVVRQMVCVQDEEDSDEANWEVARACLILGQYATALGEFNRLIDSRFKPVSAAKNMLRCHIGMSAFDEAINQYKEWSLSGLFSLKQMENIRTFLQELLYKNKIDRLITNSRTENIDHDEGSLEDDFIDIIGVKLTMRDDSGTVQETMLDVNYQKGSTFSVVVPQDNLELLDYLEIGQEVNALDMYSSSILFSERCLVCQRSKVKYGPRNGDYSVSLKILESE